MHINLSCFKINYSLPSTSKTSMLPPSVIKSVMKSLKILSPDELNHRASVVAATTAASQSTSSGGSVTTYANAAIRTASPLPPCVVIPADNNFHNYHKVVPPVPAPTEQQPMSVPLIPSGASGLRTIVVTKSQLQKLQHIKPRSHNDLPMAAAERTNEQPALIRHVKNTPLNIRPAVNATPADTASAELAVARRYNFVTVNDPVPVPTQPQLHVPSGVTVKLVAPPPAQVPRPVALSAQTPPQNQPQAQPVPRKLIKITKEQLHQLNTHVSSNITIKLVPASTATGLAATQQQPLPGAVEPSIDLETPTDSGPSADPLSDPLAFSSDSDQFSSLDAGEFFACPMPAIEVVDVNAIAEKHSNTDEPDERQFQSLSVRLRRSSINDGMITLRLYSDGKPIDVNSFTEEYLQRVRRHLRTDMNIRKLFNAFQKDPPDEPSMNILKLLLPFSMARNLELKRHELLAKQQRLERTQASIP